MEGRREGKVSRLPEQNSYKASGLLVPSFLAPCSVSAFLAFSRGWKGSRATSIGSQGKILAVICNLCLPRGKCRWSQSSTRAGASP